MPNKTKEEGRKYFKVYYDRMTPEERAAYNRSKYRANKSKYAERSKAWRQANPEHAHASTHQTVVKKKYPEAFAASDITTEALRDWLKAMRGTPCPLCHDPCTDIDHIVALSSGGPHVWSNIRMLCGFCNGMKSTLSTDELEIKLDKIFKVRELNASRAV